MNFLEETITSIKEYNYEISDIIFIGSNTGEYSCSWEEFVKLADIEYKIIGGVKINPDLIILFNDHSILYRLIKNTNFSCESWYLESYFLNDSKRKPIKSFLI